MQHRYKSKSNNRYNHILGVIFLIGLFLPHNGLLLLVNPLLVLFLAFYKRQPKMPNNLQFLIAVTMIISLLINIDDISFHSAMRFLSILELILFFPFGKNSKIPNVYFYSSIIFIFLSQIAYMENISFMIRILDTIYRPETDLYIYQSDYLIENAAILNVYNSRFGGLYHNPNLASMYLSFIAITYLIENHRVKGSAKISFVILYIVALVFAGSRTGLLIMIFVVLKEMKPYFRKNAVSIITIVSLILIPFFVKNIVFDDFRIFDISDGLNGSMAPKWRLFVEYLVNQTSVFKLLFGIFNTKLMSNYNKAGMMDSEWGEMVASYGFMFLILFVIFIVYSFKQTKSDRKMLFLILSYSISATVIFNFRASFLFFFLLSKYSQNSDVIVKKIKQKIINTPQID